MGNNLYTLYYSCNVQITARVMVVGKLNCVLVDLYFMDLTFNRNLGSSFRKEKGVRLP